MGPNTVQSLFIGGLVIVLASYSIGARLQIQDGFLLHTSHRPLMNASVQTCTKEAVLIRHNAFNISSVQSQNFNISWGEELLQPLHCASHFVVLMNGSQVVCSDFDLTYSPASNSYSCEVSLNECREQQLMLTLEIWLVNNTLREINSPFINVNCSLAEEENEEDSDNKNKEDNSKFRPTPSPSSECSFGSWSKWSSCSISCGPKPGVQRRTRVSDDCNENEEQLRSCPTNKCPQDCTLSAWGPWSPCSQSCGTGTRIRVRTILSEARFGGQRCPSTSSAVMEHKERCLVNACPVDGKWGEWSRWSYCSTSCGQGTKVRQRHCDQPRPEMGGKPCQGMDTQTKQCQIKSCPRIDGQWSSWSRWSGCSSDCGQGEVKRSRKCDSPEPEHGGIQCIGDEEQKRPCYRQTNCTFINATSAESNLISNMDENISEKEPKLSLPWSDSSLRPTPAPSVNINGIATNTTSSALKSNDCLDNAPFVDGYNGPFMSSEVGNELYYECHNGFVNDQRTNERRFIASCTNNESNNDHSMISSMPYCKPALKCIGPVLLLGSQYSVPRRDPRVNSELFALCSKSVIRGSCFPDGIARFRGTCDSDKYRNSMRSSAKVVTKCSERALKLDLDMDNFGWIEWSTEDNSNEERNTRSSNKGASLAQLVDLVARLASNQTSGLQLTNPFITDTNKNTRCSLILRAKPGQAIRLGLESRPDQDVRIQIEQGGWHHSKEVLHNEAENVFQSLTNEMRIEVQFYAAQQQREGVRFNYQVVWPSHHVE